MADTTSVAAGGSNVSEMRALQQESQQFQLGMAQLQAEDAKAKSVIAVQQALTASDRENANRVAQFMAK